jgi:hypothetical protein
VAVGACSLQVQRHARLVHQRDYDLLEDDPISDAAALAP